jgi:hypothetical protein
LGAVEQRIPVGRAERAGDREGERKMQAQIGVLTRKRKRKNDGEKERERGESEGKRRAEWT